MDISRIKEDTELTESNTKGFEVGDHIVIQEKVDGSNAAIAYDSDTDKLVAFSRKQELNEVNTLNGFYNWVQTLNCDEFKEYPDYVFSGNGCVNTRLNTYKMHIRSSISMMFMIKSIRSICCNLKFVDWLMN